MPARLQEHYTKTIREALIKEFSYPVSYTHLTLPTILRV